MHDFGYILLLTDFAHIAAVKEVLVSLQAL